MNNILTTVLLCIMTSTVCAQSTKAIKIYQKGGDVDSVTINNGMSLSHSNERINGGSADDIVTLCVTTDNGTRKYLIEDIDSIVMPDGKRVVFKGSTVQKPKIAKAITGDATPYYIEPGNKSSFSGDFPGNSGNGNVTFHWTENDRIRLDAGYESKAQQLSEDRTNATFLFDADDLFADEYTVFYPDKNVTIQKVQNQNGADNTEHIGTAGDCGSATATLNEDGTYSFTLTHKAAYICFLPHIDYLPSAKITKIVLSCNNAIAGKYQLSKEGLYNPTETSTSITLNLNPKDEKDFFIGHYAKTEQDTCAAYMVIAPQGTNRNFTALYYITDTLSHIDKVFAQSFTFNPVANTVYPVTCRIPDSEFHSIDLGLSTNWSDVNIDATEPSKEGTVYDNNDEANAALLEKSIVTQWLMPTEAQTRELKEKCTWKWGEYNGKTGYIVTGARAATDDGNVHRIFLPYPSSSQVDIDVCLAANSRPVEALMVDLGLPSGTQWASRNVGANAPEDYGRYYAWGELEEKESYSTTNYSYYRINLGEDFDISGTQHDIATQKWGGAWRIPTSDELSELMNNCTWTDASINGVRGFLVQGNNNNKIFLPNAGIRSDFNLTGSTVFGSYVSSIQSGEGSEYFHALCWNMNYQSGERYLRTDGNYYPLYSGGLSTLRQYGHTIRPVAKANATTPDGDMLNIATERNSWKFGNDIVTLKGIVSTTTPLEGTLDVGFVIGTSEDVDLSTALADYPQTVSVAGLFTQNVCVHDNIGYWYKAYVKSGDNIYYGIARQYGAHMVDLGLTSGTLWANMNVGASSQEESGNYYAWGETEPKDVYSDKTYTWNETNLGDDLDISGSQFDAAHVVMGNAWEMPTSAEMQELVESCTWTESHVNGVRGYTVTGTNGNSIFLPNAGVMTETTLRNNINGAAYTASTQSGNESQCSYAMYWNMGYNSQRYFSSSSGYYPMYESNQANYRYYGHTIRAVAHPNAKTTDGQTLHIITSKADWDFGDATATIGGTLSSVAPLQGTVTAGIILSKDRNLDISNAEQTIPLLEDKLGEFTQQMPVYDNMGYWYRAYVKAGEEIFYGDVLHYGLEMVDLALPSGTLWANMNVGASSQEDYGDYYAWGETETKSEYSSATYEHGTSDLGDALNIAGTEYDAAHVNMGNVWQMPDNVEMQELMDNCTWTESYVNGVRGYMVTSNTNGNSIFLPNSGVKTDTGNNYFKACAAYPTSVQSSYGSSLAYAAYWNMNYNSELYFGGSSGYYPLYESNRANNRYYGRTIRAVAHPQKVGADGEHMGVLTGSATWDEAKSTVTLSGELCSTAPVSGDVTVGFVVSNHPNIELETTKKSYYNKVVTADGVFSMSVSMSENEDCYFRAFLYDGTTYFYGKTVSFGSREMVDLGLPSGTLWANMNVGANSPEEIGDYYAWGETETKVSYASDTYTLVSGSDYIDIDEDIAGTSYDVAHQKWDNKWVMPSLAQIQELQANCTLQYVTVNGNPCYILTSKLNSRQILLPQTGVKGSNGTVSNGSYWAFYWSSTKYDAKQAYRTNLYSKGTFNTHYLDRASGLPVRPVIKGH